jgi:hypothetical protein
MPEAARQLRVTAGQGDRFAAAFGRSSRTPFDSPLRSAGRATTWGLLPHTPARDQAGFWPSHLRSRAHVLPTKSVSEPDTADHDLGGPITNRERFRAPRVVR